MSTGRPREHAARSGSRGYASRMPARLCLAIETSNPSVGASVGVGLLHDDRSELLASEPLREVGRNEDDLLPAIDRVVRAAGVTARDLRVVCVSIGPGGYTSLRVACAAGKMIAEAAGAMAAPVPTAGIARVGVGGADVGRVGVCLASKDESVHVTEFPAGWTLERGVPPGQVLRGAEVPLERLEVLVGDRFLPPSLFEQLRGWGGRVVDPALTPAGCLEIARYVGMVDPMELNPLYPREPDAVTLWRARHGDSRAAGERTNL